VSHVDAVAFFSGNPAKIYKLESVGSIEVGKRANFVVVNSKNEVETVIFEGKVVSPS
jgi:N-acetylglucosamine-6-phosphate deacetylase